MTRHEIYDHLAQVYLGKSRKNKEDEVKRKRQFNSWLLINALITLIIFGSVFYGLTAFLTKQGLSLKSNVLYSLHPGIIRLEYNFNQPFPPVQSFVLSIPKIDASKYGLLQFAVRGTLEGNPKLVKVIITNHKNETAYYYIKEITLDWQEVNIPLGEFKTISDWATLKDVSFTLESWNVQKDKGILLVDDVNFLMASVADKRSVDSSNATKR